MWVFQIQLICAVVARMSLLSPKLCFGLLAALSNLQMVLPHPPWNLHEQKQAAWFFSWVSAFYLSPSLVRNIANVKAVVYFFCSLTVVAGLSISVSVTDAGRQDVGSPFHLVPYKGCVPCGLCSPAGIRMKRVACWAGHTLWKHLMSGHWCVPLAFIPGIHQVFRLWFSLKKGGIGLIIKLGCVFHLTRGRLMCPYVACTWSLCQSEVVSQRSGVVESCVLTSETPEHRAKVILRFKPSLKSVSCPSHSSIPHDDPDDQKIHAQKHKSRFFALENVLLLSGPNKDPDLQPISGYGSTIARWARICVGGHGGMELAREVPLDCACCCAAEGRHLLQVIPARLVMWLWKILLWLEMCPQHEVISSWLLT